MIPPAHKVHFLSPFDMEVVHFSGIMFRDLDCGVHCLQILTGVVTAVSLALPQARGQGE